MTREGKNLENKYMMEPFRRGKEPGHAKMLPIFGFAFRGAATAFAASAPAKRHHSVRTQSQQDKRIKSKHERIKVELRRTISDVESMSVSGALDLYESSSVLY